MYMHLQKTKQDKKTFKFDLNLYHTSIHVSINFCSHLKAHLCSCIFLLDGDVQVLTLKTTSNSKAIIISEYENGSQR